jgi:uncharacterized protein YjbI with pentapeptide repeats
VLLQGSQAWNQFRSDNPGAHLDLSGVDAPPTGLDLSGANLRGVKLSNALLEFVKLDGADLRGANLNGSRLFGATLTNANLQRANLKHTFLIGTDLTKADFSRANLRRAILSGSIQSGTNFSKANLKDTQFRFVNQSVSREVANGEIAPVNFKNADLKGAAFRLAILRNANLVGTNLEKAKDIFAADFTGATLYETHPERFVKKQPEAPRLPETVWINPPEKKSSDK